MLLASKPREWTRLPKSVEQRDNSWGHAMLKSSVEEEEEQALMSRIER